MDKKRHPEKLTPKSKTHTVIETTVKNQLARMFAVTSGHTGQEYTVTILAGGGAMCTCDWAKYRPAENHGQCGCSHTIAALAYIESERSNKLSGVHTSKASAQNNHRRVLDIGDGLYLATRKAES